MIDVDGYLRRIGHTGPVRADAATLRSVHRAWLATVPYENLDIQLGRVPDLTPDGLYDKIVTRRRGGFCFEMNGALGQLLAGLGLPVRYARAAVNHDVFGEDAWGNHVALLVSTPEGEFIADAGLGDGFLEPIPLAIGTYEQGPLVYQVRHRLDGGWQLVHHPAGASSGFLFDEAPTLLSDNVERCRWMATDPTSPFVRRLTVQQPRADHALILRSRTLVRQGPTVKHSRELADPAEFAAILRNDFNLPALPESDLAVLWRRAGEQQAEWNAARASESAAADAR